MWAAGYELRVRWVENNDMSNDHCLAIDNLTFTVTAVPGLGTYAPVLPVLKRRERRTLLGPSGYLGGWVLTMKTPCRYVNSDGAAGVCAASGGTGALVPAAIPEDCFKALRPAD